MKELQNLVNMMYSYPCNSSCSFQICDSTLGRKSLLRTLRVNPSSLFSLDHKVRVFMNELQTLVNMMCSYPGNSSCNFQICDSTLGRKSLLLSASLPAWLSVTRPVSTYRSACLTLCLFDFFSAYLLASLPASAAMPASCLGRLLLCLSASLPASLCLFISASLAACPFGWLSCRYVCL